MGVHEAHGSGWPAVPFTQPVDRSAILTAEAEVRIARRLCDRFGLGLGDCVAYGDSVSDAQIFRAVPHAVAVNADRHLAGLATHTYTGGDLRAAYTLVRDRAALREAAPAARRRGSADPEVL